MRGVGSRHNLPPRHERQLRLEEGHGRALSDDQVRLLERFSSEFRERYVGTRHTGDLGAVDTVFVVGHLEASARSSCKSALDCHSHYAWGRI